MLKKINKKVFLISIVVLSLILIIPAVLSAKVNFKSISVEKIDLDNLKINKSKFFDYIKDTIRDKPKGLGTFGRVSFIPCDIKINGEKLSGLKNLKGKELKFFSNPSCDQVVIRKVISQSYQYKKKNLSSYKDKKCMFSLQKVFSPLLEYYTIKFEEKFIKDCPYCASAEKSRINQISDIQNKVKNYCKSEGDKILTFINDLDVFIEREFKEKNSKK